MENVDSDVAALLAGATTEAEGVEEIANELPGIRELVGQLREARDRKTEHEQRIKALDIVINAVEEKVRDAMVDSGIQNMRVEGVGLAYLSSALYPNVGDPQKFVAWLDNNGYGDMAQRGVHPSTLRSWWKERTENGDALPGEDVATAFVKTSVRLRRS